MTYEDFLKTFIGENKCKVSKDRIFSGYNFPKYYYDDLVNKAYNFISDKMNADFPKPDINSKEYHNYYRSMMVMKTFCEAFRKYGDKLLYLAKPSSTEVYIVRRD